MASIDVVWRVAFGLQATDGLKVTRFMRSLAKRHAAGELDFEEIFQALHNYHLNYGDRLSYRAREADTVATRIARLLFESPLEFELSPEFLLRLHKYLFEGFIPEDSRAGAFRSIDIAKWERVLGGASVEYAPAVELPRLISGEFEAAAAVDWAALSPAARVDTARAFVSRVWHAHPFREGNTRTSALFTVLLLRWLSIEVDPSPFVRRAHYFRDALVLDNAPEGTVTAGRDSSRYLRVFFARLTPAVYAESNTKSGAVGSAKLPRYPRLPGHLF